MRTCRSSHNRTGQMKLTKRCLLRLGTLQCTRRTSTCVRTQMATTELGPTMEIHFLHIERTLMAGILIIELNLTAEILTIEPTPTAEIPTTEPTLTAEILAPSLRFFTREHTPIAIEILQTYVLGERSTREHIQMDILAQTPSTSVRVGITVVVIRGVMTTSSQCTRSSMIYTASPTSILNL